MDQLPRHAPEVIVRTNDEVRDHLSKDPARLLVCYLKSAAVDGSSSRAMLRTCCKTKRNGEKSPVFRHKDVLAEEERKNPSTRGCNTCLIKIGRSLK